MSGAPTSGLQAGNWEPSDAAPTHLQRQHPMKMAANGPALNTVNLSAVSATLGGAAPGATSPGYSSASSPFAQGSSPRSSPYNLSRTGSGGSEHSLHHQAPADAPASAAVAQPSGEQLTEAALEHLKRQANLAAATGVAGSGGSNSDSPRGASTPRPQGNRSNLGPPSASEAPLGVDAALQGLSLSGAASPAAAPPLNFHAPPPGALPQRPPVEVFAKFPQEQTAFARPHAGRGGNAIRHNGHSSMGFGGAGASPFAAVAGAPPSAGHSAGGFGNTGTPAPHQPGFFVGSPPGGFGLPMPFGPSHSAGVPPVATTAGFPAPAFFPQPLGSPHQQQAGFPMMLPPNYFGMPLPGTFPPQAAGPYGMFLPPNPSGMAGARGGGKAAQQAAYEAAEYARQYQAMMSYMQGFGMMVSPSTSPDRMGRAALPAAYRRPLGNERQDSRARMLGRPSRLSLDMSASKSENGDAHRLDPELAPLVAEDRCELQSALLEEYKANRDSGRQWALKDLQGHLYPFCRDQHGSRLVQQQLEGAAPEELEEMFGEVRHKLLPLMVDVFGNYVVQRFLERGGPEVQGAVAAAIRGRALPLSLQMYGCRVVQKALEVLPQDERVGICTELTEHTLRCVRDQNGNHVIQKVIECVQPSDPARAMIEIIVNKCQTLSIHTFGCRLVQRVLEFCSIPELREQVITDVLDNTLQLSHDQYGNYVVQHLVAKGPEPAREAIVGRVAPQVMTLAQHKYASNVVEACLKHGGQPHRDAIIEQMISESGVRPPALVALMRDQYGNYVVQRALEVASQAQRAALLAAIKPHLDSLRKYTYGKHIVNKAEAMMAAQAAEEQGASAAGCTGPEAEALAPPLPTPLPLPK